MYPKPLEDSDLDHRLWAAAVSDTVAQLLTADPVTTPHSTQAGDAVSSGLIATTTGPSGGHRQSRGRLIGWWLAVVASLLLMWQPQIAGTSASTPDKQLACLPAALVATADALAEQPGLRLTSAARCQLSNLVIGNW